MQGRTHDLLASRSGAQSEQDEEFQNAFREENIQGACHGARLPQA